MFEIKKDTGSEIIKQIGNNEISLQKNEKVNEIRSYYSKATILLFEEPPFMFEYAEMMSKSDPVEVDKSSFAVPGKYNNGKISVHTPRTVIKDFFSYDDEELAKKIRDSLDN